MILTCSICGKEFEYHKTRYSRNIPIVCGSFDKQTGKWIRNEDCRLEYYRRKSREWREKNPKKTKQYYEKNKATRVYVYKHSKGKPKPAKKYYCKWPGCRRQTANGGVNRFYCWYHQSLIRLSCADGYENCGYGPDWEYLEEMYGDEVKSLEMER